MAEQLDLGTFTGAHPTTAQLVDQLRTWGFRQRRADGVHLVFRGPRGGTLRVLRSLLGRADADVVDKAARLLEVDPSTFWAGPAAHAEQLAAARATPDGEPGSTTAARATVDGVDGAGEPAARAVPATVQAAPGGEPRGGPADPRDQIIAQVLAVHVAMDQPLSLGQVMQLCDEQLTRMQVSGASSQLCRDGQLVRIRSGVYQWAGDTPHHRAVDQPAPPRRPTHPRRPALTRPTSPPVAPALAAATTPAPRRPVSVALFAQLFPDGVQMTAEMLTDLEQWTRLTDKLVARRDAS